MMPRPVLRENFNLTYRKIPVLAIGHDIYCDTSLILEVLEHTFPPPDYPSLYPGGFGGSNRPLIRGFASYWTDRPFFRVTTGLIPSSVWRTSFGSDRAALIGHNLNPEKLEAKVPQNLSGLDMHLSILEPQFSSSSQGWMFSTTTPSLADISLFYQLDWGNDIAAGRGIENLTGGGTKDTNTEGATSVFNAQRYPNLWNWHQRMKTHFLALPGTEARIERSDVHGVDMAMMALWEWKAPSERVKTIPTPAGPHQQLDKKNGLVIGNGLKVSIAPDDTGRADPTVGTLVGLSPEEVVIEPLNIDGRKARVGNVRLHFPRLGFVIKSLRESKL